MSKKKTAIIIGAGPAGLTAAYELIKNTDINMQTPMIGEIIFLDKKNNFSKWWKDYK